MRWNQTLSFCTWNAMWSLLKSFIFSLLVSSIINCQSTNDNKCSMSTETTMFVPTVTNNITARNSKSCWRRSVELCLLCHVTSNNKNVTTNDIKNGVDKSGIGKGTSALIKFLDHERQGRSGISNYILFTSEKGPAQVHTYMRML